MINHPTLRYLAIAALLGAPATAAAQIPRTPRASSQSQTWATPIAWVGGGYERAGARGMAGAEIWFPALHHPIAITAGGGLAIPSGGYVASLGLELDAGRHAGGDLVAIDARAAVYANALNGASLEAGLALYHLRVALGYCWNQDRPAARPAFTTGAGRLISVTYRLRFF